MAKRPLSPPPASAGHHRKFAVDIPAWVEQSKNFCLQSVAEDVYTAKAFAVAYGAPHDDSCSQLMQAGMKSLRRLENTKLPDKIRCSEGDRAARKFWEAKSCARRVSTAA